MGTGKMELGGKEDVGGGNALGRVVEVSYTSHKSLPL